MILGELIEKLGGNLIEGDPEWIVESVNSCERASPFDLAFADSPDSTTAALSGHAGVVVLKPGAAASYPRTKSVVETEQPRLWFARAARLLTKPLTTSGINHAAVVSHEAVLAPGVVVGAGAVIASHVHIGELTRIEAGVILAEGVVIGAHCHILRELFSIPAPRWEIVSSSTLAPFSAPMALAMSATLPPAHTLNSRSRELSSLKTTSRLAPIPPSTAELSPRLAFAAAQKSTTSFTSGTTATSEKTSFSSRSPASPARVP